MLIAIITHSKYGKVGEVDTVIDYNSDGSDGYAIGIAHDKFGYFHDVFEKREDAEKWAKDILATYGNDPKWQQGICEECPKHYRALIESVGDSEAYDMVMETHTDHLAESPRCREN